jgi:hypothetical protein
MGSLPDHRGTSQLSVARMEQRMGLLPDHRVGPGAVFQLVAVDRFGPIEYQGVINKRQVGKG